MRKSGRQHESFHTSRRAFPSSVTHLSAHGPFQVWGFAERLPGGSFQRSASVCGVNATLELVRWTLVG